MILDLTTFNLNLGLFMVVFLSKALTVWMRDRLVSGGEGCGIRDSQAPAVGSFLIVLVIVLVALVVV